MQPRPYLKTHPHISFEFDFAKLRPVHRELLGEAYARCRELANYLEHLNPDTYQKLLVAYIAKGIQATTAIEGSILTAKEVEEVISRPTPDPQLPKLSPAEHEQMARNVQSAYELIRKRVQSGKAEISGGEICMLNDAILKDLKLKKGVVPGRIRHHPVKVADDYGAPAEDCDFLLAKLSDWLNGTTFVEPNNPRKNFQKQIIKAILAHLYVLYIHPFGDGNGRTARALEVQILAKYGISAPATQLLSNHYNKTREEYYEQIACSRSPRDKAPANPNEFILYALQGFAEGLETLTEFVAAEIGKMTQELNWETLVRRKYEGKTSQPARRQQMIAFALPFNKRTPISRVRLLTPEIAKSYFGKTDKTVTRDIGVLEDKELVVNSPNWTCPNLEALKNNLNIEVNFEQ